jgi:NAD+ kinase
VNATRAVGLVPHRDRPLAHTLAQAAAAWFGERGVEVRLPPDEAKAAGLPHLATPIEAFAPGLDLVVSIGGDGTMLHTVQLAYPAGVPILGVNAGQLGYLTAIEPAELDGALPRLLGGAYAVAERTMLEVEVTSGGATRREHALNEAVLEKRQPGHLVRLELSINGTPFTTYAADGVIVATPTGSTAYSFSARGPIASPALACLMLTPISPHMLFDRTLVLAPHEELDLSVRESREVVCTMDGRHIDVLVPGDRVVCRVAADPLRVVELRSRDFHQILKAKFSLPDR